MRARKVALTAFLLAPLVVLVILCWLIVLEIDRQNRPAPSSPPPANQGPVSGG